MKEILSNIFAVEVPKGAERFETSIQPDKIPCVTYWYKENPEPTVISIRPGSYEILFTTKKCKEDQAQSVVGKEGVHPSWPHNPLYTNYSKSNLYIDDARESLKTLLRSHGLDENKNYLLLKKIS